MSRLVIIWALPQGSRLPLYLFCEAVPNLFLGHIKLVHPLKEDNC